MTGHIDWKVEGKREGLEIKNRGAWMAGEYGETGTDEVMLQDLFQCMHYLAITGYDAWNLAVYFGGDEFRDYRIPRDDEFIEGLIETEADFYDALIGNTEPPAFDTGHRNAHSLANRLWRGRNDELLVLDETAASWHAVAQEAADKAKHYDAVAKGAKLHIRELMGDHAVAMLPDGSTYEVTTTKRKGYTVEPTEYVSLRHKRAKAA